MLKLKTHSFPRELEVDSTFDIFKDFQTVTSSVSPRSEA